MRFYKGVDGRLGGLEYTYAEYHTFFEITPLDEEGRAFLNLIQENTLSGEVLSRRRFPNSSGINQAFRPEFDPRDIFQVQQALLAS